MFKKLRIPSLLPFFKKNKLYFLCSVVSIVLGIGVYVMSNYYVVDTIEVRGLSRGQELYGITALEKQNLLLINVSKTEEIIKKQNPHVKTVSVSKEYPRKISIIVSTYFPLANLKTQVGYFVLSEDGRILAKQREENKNLPSITYYENFPYHGYSAGQSFKFKDIQYALHFLQKLHKLGIKINSIDIDGLHMLGLYADEKKQKILFSAEKDRDRQDYELQAVITQLKREGKEFTLLDLRFDKPIVVLQK